MTTVMIVGGTSGLGLEIARKYADGGWSVVLTGRDPARAEVAAKEIGGDSIGLSAMQMQPWIFRRLLATHVA